MKLRTAQRTSRRPKRVGGLLLEVFSQSNFVPHSACGEPAWVHRREVPGARLEELDESIRVADRIVERALRVFNLNEWKNRPQERRGAAKALSGMIDIVRRPPSAVSTAE